MSGMKKRMRTCALLGGAAMLLALCMAPTLAMDTQVYGYDYIAEPSAYGNVIAQGYNKNGEPIPGAYLYFDDETYFEDGKAVEGKVFSAVRYGDDFFGDLGEDNNIFHWLNGDYQRWTGAYVCGGEDLDPSTLPQEVLMFTTHDGREVPGILAHDKSGRRFGFVDASYYPDNNQGAVGDGKLQGNETGDTHTDVTMFLPIGYGYTFYSRDERVEACIHEYLEDSKLISLDTIWKWLNPGQTVDLGKGLHTDDVASVEWASSNEKVATVDQNGIVTAIADGGAKIAAKITMKGGWVYGADCRLSVYDNLIDATNTTLQEDGSYLYTGYGPEQYLEDGKTYLINFHDFMDYSILSTAKVKVVEGGDRMTELLYIDPPVAVGDMIHPTFQIYGRYQFIPNGAGNIVLEATAEGETVRLVLPCGHSA